MSESRNLQLSVVIPVYNEEGNLPTLFARLYPVLDGLGRSYEILFTNDGSVDRSSALLAAQFAERPDVRYGLTAMCVGLGQGGSVIWENPHFDGKKRK